MAITRPRHSTDKEKVRKWAIKNGRARGILWRDERGIWHAATDRFNTPLWASETEPVTEEQHS